MAHTNGGQYRWKPGRVFLRCTRCRRRIKGVACADPKCSKNRGRWYFEFDKGPRGIPGNQVMRGGYPSKEAALAAMHTLQHELHVGEYVEESDETVRQFLLRWLPAQRHHLKGSTSLNYQGDINRILALIGPIPLRQLHRRTLMDAYTKLADGGYSPATVQRTHLTLHIALKNAVDDGLLRRNPADRAFNIRLRLPQTDCLTPAEADTFLAMEREAIQYAAWRLSLTRGLRPGELCGLQDADVDLRAGRIFIRYALSLKAAAPGEPGPKVRYELDDPKTPTGRRSLDLDTLTVEALRRYRAARKAEQEAMGAAFQDQGYFFAQADGRPWSPAELGTLFKRRAEKAGIRKLSLYALRHTAASVASDLGVPIKEISTMLGHTSIRTTARYLHTFPGSSARSAHAIAAAIDGAAEKRDLVDQGDDNIVELPVSSPGWR